MPERNKDTARRGRVATAGRAQQDEKLYAQRVLLERIQSSENWIGSSQLKAYVERHCSWAEYGSVQARSRTLDNWLSRFRTQAEQTGDFEFDYQPNTGYRYKAGKRHTLSLETASLVLLAERLLQPFLPRAHVESGLHSLFQAAQGKLNEHEKQCGRNGDAVGALLERIALDQRGQRLQGSEAAATMVPVVTEAILKRKCVDVLHKGCKKRLHPFGLVFRDPKYYLLAVDDNVLRESGGQSTHWSLLSIDVAYSKPVKFPE